VARNKGYEQVTEFYKNRPGILNPPYVYGYLPGPKENSAVFWCQKEHNDKQTFYLMFMFKNRTHKLCNCPDVIEWHNYPKGLSICSGRDVMLDGFVYINEPKKEVPKNVRLIHNAILSEYDGVEEIFYCHDGEWVVMIRH
jgi:hypothetical protein